MLVDMGGDIKYQYPSLENWLSTTESADFFICSTKDAAHVFEFASSSVFNSQMEKISYRTPTCRVQTLNHAITAALQQRRDA
ncbi:unnamed protein product [Cylicocyclus nassatus]|uniref:Uncharacterized protein n=1 Tax=Cylicocyclus nassatus TaxID=53992 RepID=A0AA36GIA5_CYLNA|nr:unnamed protein product [Cylicocyclus nassatus]